VKSAREEFELARKEKDPVLIMKMILTSREAMRKVSDKVREIDNAFILKIKIDQ